MATLVDHAVRAIFRREAIPIRLRWWFAAEGMGDWFEFVLDGLTPHLAEVDDRHLDRDGTSTARHRAARVIAEVAAPMFRRRHELLRASFPTLPLEPGPVMGALYRIASAPSRRWIFEPLGGAPRGFRGHLAAERALAAIPIERRWIEVTSHLGELLIAMTERMPARLPRIRPILGELCFDAGARFGMRFRKSFGMPGGDAGRPEDALELLRMAELIFRVNPEHWGGTETAARSGWLEGTACPWFVAPGWTGAHCGIFGQFQSGIASAFGLRYHLTTTIPKNGGHTCRIDVKPITLGRGPSGRAPKEAR
jgi:hypothetical protein